jgi:5-methylcytosine-specific restriction protein A
MKPLHDIYSGYRQTAAELSCVPDLIDEPCLVAAKHVLPGFFLHQIEESGRGAGNYRCYGSYGEPYGPFADVPWIVCYKHSDLSTEKRAYVVAMLFRKDMTGCWLSLNQGFTQGNEPQGIHQVAGSEPLSGTSALTHLSAIPDQFVVGPIDLAATSTTGRRYEVGAGVSRFYSATAIPSETELAADFLQLLDLYDQIAI